MGAWQIHADHVLTMCAGWLGICGYRSLPVFSKDEFFGRLERSLPAHRRAFGKALCSSALVTALLTATT